jgi:hypothetical protein
LRASYAAHLEAGDNIEIYWDGVVRTVTYVGTDAADGYIDFTRVDPRIQYKSQAIANWKKKTDFTIDLTPAADNPLRGNSSRSGDIGSTINTVRFMQCDFAGSCRYYS